MTISGTADNAPISLDAISGLIHDRLHGTYGTTTAAGLGS